jgi:hypothetical protein
VSESRRRSARQTADPTSGGELTVGLSTAATPVDADLDLRRERALGDLAVDGGSRQPGPGKDSFQTDNTVGFAHGLRCLLLAVSDDC